MARIEEVHETHVTPGRKSSSKQKETPAGVKYYLAAYNALSAVGWSYVLLTSLTHILDLDNPSLFSTPYAFLLPLTQNIPFFPPSTPALVASELKFKELEALLPAPEILVPVLRRATTTYARVGFQTAIVQTFAALEVVHSLVGFVRSPVFTTAMQVSSRYFLVWAIANVFPSAQRSPFYASMVLSWSLTEVIRYSHYTLTLLSLSSPILLYLRYTTFYLLYPTGAGSEAFTMLASLPPTGPSTYTPYDWFRAVLFVIWWPGLAFLMGHMQRQRSKALGGNKTAKTKTA